MSQSPSEIWSGWDAAVARMDPKQMGVLVAALGSRLRTEEDMTVYQDLSDRLTDTSRSVEERIAIADVLERAATPDAVGILLDYLEQSDAWSVQGGAAAHRPESEVQGTARNAVLTSARTLIDGSRNWGLAPELQDSWLAAENDYSPASISAIGQSMAFLGKPEGVAALIKVVARGGSEDRRYDAAVAALQQVHANDAVGTLGKALNEYADNPALTQSIVTALLSAGSADAASVLATYSAQHGPIAGTLGEQVQSFLSRQKPQS